MKAFIILLLICFFNTSLFADVRLPAIIGDHMVLQQQSEVKLWGWCEPNEPISIKVGWDTTTYKTTGTSNAKWSVTIKTNTKGGPYLINIKGYNTLQITDVLLGEVWVCSGQSNMEMHFNWGLKQYTADVNNATNQSIRLFHIPRLTSEFPQDDTKGKWVVCSPNDVINFSLVGYFFGRDLQEKMNVPVGLINTSWGGTPAEVWTPKEVVDADSVLRKVAATFHPSQWGPVKPGLTYNAMSHPITNYSIAGTIWYQGENNVDHAKTYQQLFTSMIGGWRQAWQKDFPFYYVQIAPYAGYGNGISSALLREAQTKSLSYPKTGMIVISDLVDNINDIHPQMKREVGQRLAAYVLADNYDYATIGYKSPAYKSMSIEKDKVRIIFENVGGGLVSKSGSLTDFYIAGNNKKFFPAKAKIEKNTVVVYSDSVTQPVAVRFGFTNSAMPNLFSKDGLPVNIFRTDDWDVDTDTVQQ